MDTRKDPFKTFLQGACATASLVVGGWLFFVTDAAWGQSPASASRASAPATAQTRQPAAAKADSQPRWADLTTAQRHALKPLVQEWTTMSTAQKRKWIALSRNFNKLSAQEQGKLQDRMGEWVALSADERSQARLNFAAAKKLPHKEKQEKWEAYQALSDDERRAFADQAPRLPIAGAATAVRPVSKQRLTKVPNATDNRVPMPRISASPHQVDQNTLLPQIDRSDAELAAP